eukprot:CAMPEP_0168327940 /NCGR_PEP_ID=MMETSP0213-20121227/6180_1 /TAXON_ID=151035 /ORGANISM="Euplotes harpa, Strain FSP1.4" /LENGTH=497 /DNA_ID=CAMNT_0008330907 /DNA_START=320 /DNA_END=1813 /DNA_ORIENTATION=+
MKEEMFSIMDVLKNISMSLSISSMSNEFLLDLQFEQGIPDFVYGDMTKFRQIIATLLNFANLECIQDLPMTAYARLLDIDAKRRYNIETKIGIPKTGRITQQSLQHILNNTKLDLSFFINFKDELHKYDFGMLVCGHLVSLLDGSIIVNEQEKYLYVLVRLPFDPKNPHMPTVTNPQIYWPSASPWKNPARTEISNMPNEVSLNPSKDILNMTKLNVSPMSGNASRNNDQSQKSSSKHDEKADENSNNSRSKQTLKKKDKLRRHYVNLQLKPHKNNTKDFIITDQPQDNLKMKKIYSESSGMSQRNFQNLYNGSNVSSGKSKNANPFVESTSKRCQLYIREKSSESDADLSREEIRSDIEEKECPSIPSENNDSSDHSDSEENGESEESEQIISQESEESESESDKINILFSYGIKNNKSSESFKKKLKLDRTYENPDEEDKYSITVNVGNKVIEKTVQHVVENSKSIHRIMIEGKFKVGESESSGGHSKRSALCKN